MCFSWRQDYYKEFQIIFVPNKYYESGPLLAAGLQSVSVLIIVFLLLFPHPIIINSLFPCCLISTSHVVIARYGKCLLCFAKPHNFLFGFLAFMCCCNNKCISHRGSGLGCVQPSILYFQHVMYQISNQFSHRSMMGNTNLKWAGYFCTDQRTSCNNRDYLCSSHMPGQSSRCLYSTVVTLQSSGLSSVHRASTNTN